LSFKEKAILVGIRDRYKKLSQVQNSLEELQRLTETAGAEVFSKVIQKINNYNRLILSARVKRKS